MLHVNPAVSVVTLGASGLSAPNTEIVTAEQETHFECKVSDRLKAKEWRNI